MFKIANAIIRYGYIDSSLNRYYISSRCLFGLASAVVASTFSGRLIASRPVNIFTVQEVLVLYILSLPRVYITSRMSGQGSSAEKGLNGVLVCQESYACGGSDEAAFECDECGSLQCTRCELELHRQDRMRNHDRIRISPGHVPYCDSCKGDGVTGGRLRAVVRCQGCKINLCLDCQKRTHSGVSKKKHPIAAYPPSKPAENNPSIGDEQLDALKASLEKVVSFLLVDEKEDMQVRDVRSQSYNDRVTRYYATFVFCNPNR